ncbi:MAG: ATP-binding cassette domain-containing protein [Dysgonamonadaceae bacterium]|jgi:NitT/TauT family transport system ATP-binding protein|nr:ATP-binding cassette domain-containing protein [Dysgonamonadaceae bacterium]
MTPFAQIKNLHLSFGGNKIIDDFNLSINHGEIYSIIGPSGCGKSSLLKVICGIIKPQKGEILMGSSPEKQDPDPVHPKKNSIGYIPQHYGLLDWLKVKDNISIGEKINHTSNPNRDEIIRILGIEDLLERYPRSLSGGQKQRVALARSWSLNPDILLMDEPFSALDMFTAETSKTLFLNLWKRHKTTTLFVTHNVREAVEIGKYIVILSERPAKVIEVMQNPLFEKGANRTEDDFFALSKEVRKKLQKVWEAKS